ncbi:MAG: peptide chain release factor 2 [Candidatus Saccharibacteria bacterium]|nr:peptide chain release factor 2 [Candidatus Saccharibacteria bacterium]
MQELEKRLKLLETEFLNAYEKVGVKKKLIQLAKLEKETAEPEIWRDVKKATEMNQEVARLSSETEPWELLKTQINDLKELIEISEGSELLTEIEGQVEAMENEFNELKKALRFNGPYDHNNAIIRITSGAGGTEAMDWAGMLERMYQRFFEKKGFKATLLERTVGEEAGIKTAVYEVNGPDAYGFLKSEHGVHRLVRLSPFNANNLRQTSFALVEILPVIESDTDVQIDDKDLRVDTYHSGGHGGQGVNTTNSAVRITHLPTGIAVAIQNERNFHQNKEKAMEILRGKLAQMQMEQNAESIDKLRAGESAGWGQQIRNYVLQPYRLIKDTRTGYETADTDGVLDGKIDEFIDAYLENF